MGNKKFNQIEINKIIDLYNSGLSSEQIAMIFPIWAALADSMPEIASSTTMQSSVFSPKFFAAIS